MPMDGFQQSRLPSWGQGDPAPNGARVRRHGIRQPDPRVKPHLWHAYPEDCGAAIRAAPPGGGPAVLEDDLAGVPHLDHRPAFDAVRLCQDMAGATGHCGFILLTGRPGSGWPPRVAGGELLRLLPQCHLDGPPVVAVPKDRVPGGGDGDRVGSLVGGGRDHA